MPGGSPGLPWGLGIRRKVSPTREVFLTFFPTLACSSTFPQEAAAWARGERKMWGSRGHPQGVASTLGSGDLYSLLLRSQAPHHPEPGLFSSLPSLKLDWDAPMVQQLRNYFATQGHKFNPWSGN